jgi:Spy/CpxP family protein refolding chaperone
MKLALSNRIYLLTISTVFGIVLPGLVLTNHPAVAQTSSNAETAITVRQFRSRLFAGVHLTSEQRNRIQEIRSTRRQRLKLALTTPQYSDLRRSIDSGKSLRESVESLNPPLSDDQKQRIGNILRDTTNQIWITLTPRQQQIVEGNLEKMQRTRVYVE